MRHQIAWLQETEGGAHDDAPAAPTRCADG
jgi:hypothetical protein